jgi:hypothetical protein
MAFLELKDDEADAASDISLLNCIEVFSALLSDLVTSLNVTNH